MKKNKAFLLLSILLGPMFIQAQISIDPIDDSFIYQAGTKADNIYGLLTPNDLIVRTSVASAEFTRNAYIMFEIGQQAGPYSNARVQLYGNVLDEKTVEIYYTDTIWTEETLTGNNRPSGTYISSSSVTIGEGAHSWDVTHYVNSAKSAGANRISFVFSDIAGAISTVDTKWHSKENPSGNGPELILTQGSPPEVYSGNYYIDQVQGSDDSSGHSPEQAWKTLSNITGLVLRPGDSLLFKSGCVWTGTFSPSGSGQPGKPVVIGKYGGKEKPLIKGEGLDVNTITLSNQHHIVLRDLSISNMGDSAGFRRAIYYLAADMGEICHIVFDNLELYDVNGDLENKNNGGMFIEITGSRIPTWFDTLVISNCHIHDVNRTGISNASSWDNRSLTTNENWVPSKNVHIHHNTFERTGANALIVRVAHKALMEFNLFDHCSIIGTGNASFSFNTDSAIWQYNEARYTKYNEGDNDAGGFDSDYRSKYTIIQYNYSHHNGYGGVLLTGGPGTGEGFNEGTIIRYNIFANNDHHIIRTSGNLTNSKIYNNVFYTGPALSNVMSLWHKSWGGTYSDETYYWDNIFYNEGNNTSVELTSSTRNEFSNNVWYGNPMQGQPYDPEALFEDPKLMDPGGDALGFEAVLQYALSAGSPAIDRGITVNGNVSYDIAGNKLPFGTAPDIGAFEWHPDTVDVLIIIKDELLSPVEGAMVWVEGYTKSPTNAKGEIMPAVILTGSRIPLTIEFSGYPTLGGSLEINPDDTATFILSKNVFDLRFIVSDSSGNLLENAKVILPGIDTLYSNSNGELFFTDLCESDNLLYLCESEGYHSTYGSGKLMQDDTVRIAMNPGSVSFEIRDMDNALLTDALVSLEGIGYRHTDGWGRAVFMPVSDNTKLSYSVEKPGFVTHSDSLRTGERDLSLQVSLEANTLRFIVSDETLAPIPSASVVFLDQIKYTNNAGEAEFMEVPLDQYLPFSIYQTGFISLKDSVIPAHTGETHYIELIAIANQKVVFKIRDKSGKALSDALVTLSGYGVLKTDSEGKATFTDVAPADNILFSVSKTGYNDTVNVLKVSDEELIMNLILSEDPGTHVDPAKQSVSVISFPNPASEFLTIEFSSPRGRLDIHDVNGRLVYSRKIISESITLNISGLKSGVYYIRFQNEVSKSISHEKLIIFR